MKPGEYFLDETGGPIEANVARKTVKVVVRNRGDRPIQVGSHFHFFETNASLGFEREKTFGMRLNIPAGTAVRFEPGEEKEVELTAFGGHGEIHGFNGFVGGPANAPGAQERAVTNAKKAGFGFKVQRNER
jgi:urease subunit beta